MNQAPVYLQFLSDTNQQNLLLKNDATAKNRLVDLS